MADSTPSSAVQRELEALGRALSLYNTSSKRGLTETVHRKAIDLRIQLYRGYWEQRYRGSRKGAAQSEGIAFREMRQRARAGQGVALRPSLRMGPPSPNAPVEYYQRRRLRGQAGTVRRLRVPVTLGTYGRRVWTELARRQAGAGVLGVAFLMQRYRKRFSSSRNAYVATGSARLRENRTKAPQLEVQVQHGYRNNPIGRLELGRDFARLEGFVPGQALVGARHSILAIALRDVRRDTEKYLYRDVIDRITAELEAAGLAVS